MTPSAKWETPAGWLWKRDKAVRSGGSARQSLCFYPCMARMHGRGLWGVFTHQVQQGQCPNLTPQSRACSSQSVEIRTRSKPCPIWKVLSMGPQPPLPVLLPVPHVSIATKASYCGAAQMSQLGQGKELCQGSNGAWAQQPPARVP